MYTEITEQFLAKEQVLHKRLLNRNSLLPATENQSNQQDKEKIS